MIWAIVSAIYNCCIYTFPKKSIFSKSNVKWKVKISNQADCEHNEFYLSAVMEKLNETVKQQINKLFLKKFAANLLFFRALYGFLSSLQPVITSSPFTLRCDFFGVNPTAHISELKSKMEVQLIISPRESRPYLQFSLVESLKSSTFSAKSLQNSSIPSRYFNDSDKKGSSAENLRKKAVEEMENCWQTVNKINDINQETNLIVEILSNISVFL